MFSFLRGLWNSDFELGYEAGRSRITEIGVFAADKEYDKLKGSSNFRNGYLCALLLIKTY